MACETVARILGAIGSEPERSEHWVAEDGRWQLGPLRGRWSKPESEHIGEASRAAARRRRAAELRAEIEACDAERAGLVQTLADLEARGARIAREYASLPSDQALRECWYEVLRVSQALPPAVDQLQKAEEECSAARRQRDAVRERRDADAADTGLAEWVEKLDQLRDHFAAYREGLAAIWPQQQRLTDIRAQRDACAVRLQRAAAERADRRERHHEADLAAQTAASRLHTLESTVGAGVEAILARQRTCQANIDAEKRAARALSERERQHDLERERAEAEIERHTADHQRHEQERNSAIERLGGFATSRLLHEADPAFEDLDLDAGWSATRGVDVARRAEVLLADTPHDDATWRRHQEAIHQHTNVLRDQLVRAGHPLEEHALEDGIAVVRCPFQGRLCTMAELEAALDDDRGARVRLLDEKEREVIENHLLGEVVLDLQQRLSDAEKWVQATNQQLAGRPTSTGMLLRFQWEADPEGPDGLESLRRQLLRTRDLWTPDERQGMAEFLQARIRDAREAEGAGSWRDLLATALDYRRWHRFAIERHQEGQWRRLTRRTYGTGSGGEKALALTLPQFAAAAAHYQSADAHAPRLILLDEVFVGIDRDMRSKCMGLLETFDLDFVMTSEREWGCYPTLPGLAIYQLSARAGVDAVVATRWVWNGVHPELAPLPVSPEHAIEPSRQPSENLELVFAPRDGDGGG